MPTTVHSNISFQRIKEGHKLRRPSEALSKMNPVVKHIRFETESKACLNGRKNTYNILRSRWVLDETSTLVKEIANEGIQVKLFPERILCWNTEDWKPSQWFPSKTETQKPSLQWVPGEFQTSPPEI